jgi:hypothetical protein
VPISSAPKKKVFFILNLWLYKKQQEIKALVKTLLKPEEPLRWRGFLHFGPAFFLFFL